MTTNNKYLEKIAKIEIKKSNKGLLHKKLGKKPGQKLSEGDLKSAEGRAKKTGNTKLEKEVVFAENAKKWKHK
jgi:hypothetical protein